VLSVMLTDYSQQLHDTFGVNMRKYTPAQVPPNIGSKVFSRIPVARDSCVMFSPIFHWSHQTRARIFG
jgi:hypothetical protein